MKIFFLEADRPLTKTFTLQNGTIDKSSYPIVRDFTSHEEDVESIEDFYNAITRHAELGHCLLKGQLSRRLDNESRAGTTSNLDHTSWLVLDFDNVDGIANAESAIQLIIPELRDTSYILQYSASAGISGETGLRAHLFFMLHQPYLPDVLKNWITYLNLHNPVLAKNVGLSSNGQALKFTLDRTVVQNDKLIYIAPPQLVGDVTDPLAGERIQLVKKSTDFAVLHDPLCPWTPAQTSNQLQQQIDTRRKELGLKARKATFKQVGEFKVLTNPEVGMVTGEKVDRRWVRINVQGESPSWAYYYDADNPTLLYNFKGSEPVYLKDFLPDYYEEVQKRAIARRAEQTEHMAIRPFAFRDRATDQFYNGTFDMANNRLIDCQPTRGDARRLAFFFGQYGQQPPGIIEDWTYEFRPWDDRLICFNDKFLNRWVPTDLLLAPPKSPSVPPLIRTVLLHALGDDEECYEHFINWLACIYQYRRKLLTAWVLHGVEGTGKGTLFSKILQPIFGRDHTVERLVSNFDDQFNSDLELALLCVIDESKADSARNPAMFMSKLKNNITEAMIAIRAMRQNPRMSPSFINFILFSNNLDAIEIASSDRRFNVAPRQERKLLDALNERLGRAPTQEDFDYIEREETPLFAGYLKEFKADLTMAQRALENEPKIRMRLASMDALEQILEAIREGNLEYFITYLEDGTINIDAPHAYQAYKHLITQWVNGIDTKIVVSSSDIQILYQYLFAPKVMPGPHKFAKMLAHKQVDMKIRHYDARLKETRRGIQTVWTLDPAIHAAFIRAQAKPTIKAAPSATA